VSFKAPARTAARGRALARTLRSFFAVCAGLPAGLFLEIRGASPFSLLPYLGGDVLTMNALIVLLTQALCGWGEGYFRGRR